MPPIGRGRSGTFVSISSSFPQSKAGGWGVEGQGCRPHLTPTPPWLPSDTGHQLLLPEGLPASALGTPLESADAVPVFFSEKETKAQRSGAACQRSRSRQSIRAVNLPAVLASEALLRHCWGGMRVSGVGG